MRQKTQSCIRCSSSIAEGRRLSRSALARCRDHGGRDRRRVSRRQATAATDAVSRIRGSMSRPLAPASLATRLARLARLPAHLARGLWLSRRFVSLAPARQDRTSAAWSRRLLAILGVRVHATHVPDGPGLGTLLVANHVSWLDIFALYTVAPGIFVAKSEIAGWPVLGRLVTNVGTIFIERGRNRHARRTNERIVATLAERGRVIVFPEGTTTDGTHVRRFHAALLQPAIAAGGMVQPVLIRYTDGRGHPNHAADYVGDTSLAQSLWSIVSARRLVAEIEFLPPLAAARAERRTLAHAAHDAIARALDPAHAGSAPETPRDPRAAPPSASPATRTPYPARADSA
jgi:1-acyl-sn-glycerol-3-phosphate acyltransferase